MHVNVGPGSYMEMTLPWVVQPDGYTTKVLGQLLHLEATTSLQYRSLVISETLEFSLRSRYPLRWNGHQEWLMHLTGCKASVWFIYSHKEFFQGLFFLFILVFHHPYHNHTLSLKILLVNICLTKT